MMDAFEKKVSTKTSEIADSLGISNAPSKITQDHVGAIDSMHDSIGETKDAMQAKHNFTSASHLTQAQRHLKGAKAALETSALNPDSKHVLAHASLGQASEALTDATRTAGGSDKSIVHSHNKGIHDFIANPDKKFAKSNDNHDEHGRFASGDGSASSSNAHSEAVSRVGDSVGKDYRNAVVTGTGKPMSTDQLNMSQAYEDGLNHLSSAHESALAGDHQGMASSLNNAANSLSEHSAFTSSAQEARNLASSIGSSSKNKALDPAIAKALDLYEGQEIMEGLGIAKYNSTPISASVSPQEIADVDACGQFVDDLRRQASVALSTNQNEDECKEIAQVISGLTYKKTILTNGDFTWAKEMSDIIGQATLGKMGQGYIDALSNLRDKLIALDENYPNHSG